MRRTDFTDQSAPIVDGVVHTAYSNPRIDVAALVPSGATSVLDVGCSVGALGASLAERGCVVTGIELDPVLAEHARERLSAVLEVDVEALAASDGNLGGQTLDGQTFDCIIFADVLEHMRDPWTVVRWAAPRVAPGGSMVISVPNIRHAKTFWSIAVRRRWPYEPVGIFDRTHLRFFARANLDDLLAGSGFAIVELTRTHLLTLDFSSRWNRLARFCGDFGTLQFVFRAERGQVAR